MSFERELQVACSAVSRARILLSTRWGQVTPVLSSVGRDIKTEMDQEAEQMILEELQSNFNYPVVSEETELTREMSEEEEYWVVDPLDGTMNFVRGIPFFSVSVGLWKGEEPLMGVVGEIPLGSQYDAAIGGMARCNGETIHVSTITSLDQAVVVTGFPIRNNFETEFLHDFVFFCQRAKKIRMLGSASLSLAYVASGKADAYFEEGIMLWDVAAGMALVKAAGGSVWIKKNPRHRWARDVYAASSAALLQDLLLKRVGSP